MFCKLALIALMAIIVQPAVLRAQASRTLERDLYLPTVTYGDSGDSYDAVRQTPKTSYATRRSVLSAQTQVEIADPGQPEIVHDGGVVDSAQQCPPLPGKEWGDHEEWAWKMICTGHTANLNDRVGSLLNPRQPDRGSSNWSDRTLSSDFLDTILLHDRYRRAIPHYGVRIVGAHLPHPVDLSSASIDRPLTVVGSLFESGVRLSHLNAAHYVSLRDSVIFDGIAVTHASIVGGLFLDDVSVKGLVDMTGARISRALQITTSQFSGPLRMNSIRVDGDLQVEDIKAAREVDLRHARINGRVLVVAGTFCEPLRLDAAHIGSDFTIRGKARFFHDLILRRVKVDGQLEVRGTEIGHDFNVNGGSVGGSVVMCGTAIGGSANLRFLSVHRNLDARAAKLKRLDLTGAIIRNTLRLGGRDEAARDPQACDHLYPQRDLERIDWTADNSQILLANVRIGALQETESSGRAVWKCGASNTNSLIG